MSKGVPKNAFQPVDKVIREKENPDNYLKLTPVWRFSDFDWEGPFGLAACAECSDKLMNHIQAHLSSFETMTWAEIMRASGGRAHGNNSHPIARDKFTKSAKHRLDERKIFADSLFSLRLDAGTRLYGVRDGHCLRIVFFDPFHKDDNRCAYDFK
jgi:hypothetical protein